MGRIYQLKVQDLIDLLEAEVRLKAIHRTSASMYADYRSLNPETIKKEVNRRLSYFRYIDEKED